MEPVKPIIKFDTNGKKGKLSQCNKQTVWMVKQHGNVFSVKF